MASLSAKHVLGVLEWFYMLSEPILFFFKKAVWFFHYPRWPPPPGVAKKQKKNFFFSKKQYGFFTTLADPPPPGLAKNHKKYGFFSDPFPKHLCWFLWPLCSADFTGWSWPCLWQSESQPHSSWRSQVIILLLLCLQIAETDPTHKLTCQQQHKHKSRQHPGYSLEAHWSL